MKLLVKQKDLSKNDSMLSYTMKKQQRYHVTNLKLYIKTSFLIFIVEQYMSQVKYRFFIKQYNLTGFTMTPEYGQILKALQQLQTENVKQAQEYFNVHSKKPQFITNLVNIMKDVNVLQSLQMMASIQLNNTFCGELAENPQYRQFFNFISNILMDVNIKNHYKRSFEKSIVLLMSISNQQTLNQWMLLVGNLFQSKLLDTAYLIIACFSVAELEQQHLLTVVGRTFQFSLANIPLIFENICNLNELLKTWIVVFDKLIEEQEESKHIIHDIVNSKKLLQIIQWVFDYEAQPQFYVCIKQGLHQLNLLKYEATQLYVRILKYGLKMKTCTYGFQLLGKIIEKVVTTLAIMGQYKSMIESRECKDFLTSLTKLLILYCKKQPISKDLWVNILNLVIFPFLEATNQQRQLFDEDYEQFNALFEDCCDYQQSGILKTQCAKLLEAIGDNVPLAIGYAIERSVQSLKIRFGMKQAPQKSPQKLLQVQTAFLVMSILSINLNHHEDLMIQLKLFFSSQFNNIVGAFQIARMFQFLAYNYSQLYKNSQQGNFLVYKALKYKGNQTVLICCMDFLSNVADEYYNDEYFKIICDRCVTYTHGSIWTTISKTIQNYHKAISQPAMCYLVNQIFKRLQNQITSIQSNKKSDTLNAINCVHILKKILEYSQQHYTVKQIIWGIVRYYQVMIKYSIQDEVISVIDQFLNQSKQLTSAFVQLLPVILIGFEKDNFQSNQYFYLLNNYIMKGQFNEVNIIIQTLLKAYNYHTQKLTKKAKQRQSIGNILLLIQNFIAYHGTKCENQLFKIIILHISRIINQSNKIITSRAINVLFLCHMHEKYPYVLELLQKYQQCYNSYDSKVILQCLSKQIFRENDPLQVAKILSLMIMISKRSVQNKEKESKLKLKSKTKKNNLKKATERIQSYENILRRIQVPFNKQLSEFDEIKRCLNTMKQNNEGLYSAIIMQLSADVKTQLSIILNSIQAQGQKRIIFKVNGVKQNKVQQLQQQQDNQRISNDIKRRRITEKKLKKFQK